MPVGNARLWRFKDAEKTRTIRLNGNIRCNSGPALLNFALNNNGITQLPDYYVKPYLRSGELIEILDDYRPDTEGVWALYPENRHLSSKVRLFIDFLSQSLKKYV